MYTVKRYTIWKYNTKKGGDATLLNEPLFRTKHRAFKRARVLAKRLVYDRGDVILVRLVTYGSPDCIEWEFPATPY